MASNKSDIKKYSDFFQPATPGIQRWECKCTQEFSFKRVKPSIRLFLSLRPQLDKAGILLYMYNVLATNVCNQSNESSTFYIMYM